MDVNLVNGILRKRAWPPSPGKKEKRGTGFGRVMFHRCTSSNSGRAIVSKRLQRLGNEPGFVLNLFSLNGYALHCNGHGGSSNGILERVSDLVSNQSIA